MTETNQLLTDQALNLAMESCPNKGSGCFADSPDSLHAAKFGVGDMLLSAKSLRLIAAALEAGEQGISLETATFFEPRLEASGRRFRISNGKERTVAAAMEDDSFRRVIGSCAYRCGQAEDCAIKALG